MNRKIYSKRRATIARNNFSQETSLTALSGATNNAPEVLWESMIFEEGESKKQMIRRAVERGREGDEWSCSWKVSPGIRFGHGKCWSVATGVTRAGHGRSWSCPESWHWHPPHTTRPAQWTVGCLATPHSGLPTLPYLNRYVITFTRIHNRKKCVFMESLEDAEVHFTWSYKWHWPDINAPSTETRK